MKIMETMFPLRAPRRGTRPIYVTKIKARIDILTWDGSMNCDRGAALNGKTHARIHILIWDGSMNCDRGAALNGKTQARIHILIWD